MWGWGFGFNFLQTVSKAAFEEGERAWASVSQAGFSHGSWRGILLMEHLERRGKITGKKEFLWLPLPFSPSHFKEDEGCPWNILFNCATSRFSLVFPWLPIRGQVLWWIKEGISLSCSFSQSLIGLNIYFPVTAGKFWCYNMARTCQVIPLNPWDELLSHDYATSKILSNQVFHPQGGTAQSEFIL